MDKADFEHPDTRSEFSGQIPLICAAAIGITTGVTATLFYSLGIFIPALQESFGWARGDISLSITVATLGLFMAGAIAGRLADRFGAAVVGATSLVLYAIIVLALALFANTLAEFWIGYFLAALVGAGSTPIVLVRPIITAFRAHRGLALGIALTGGGLAGFWVPLFAQHVITGYGWRWGYAALAATALVAAPIIWTGLRTGQRGTATAKNLVPETGMTASEARRTITFWTLSIAAFAMASGVAGLVVHLVPLFRDLGSDAMSAARLASVVGISSVLGRIVIGIALDRFRPARVSGLILGLSACGVLLLWAFGLRWSLLSVITLGLAAGAELDLLAFLTARYFGQRAYGAIYGWQYSVFALGYGLSPYVIGRMRDATGSYDPALITSAILIAVSGIAIVTVDELRSRVGDQFSHTK
ncbi:MAG: hypothetical protein JWO15_1872 [Sphingomonadales bacterium]|nr:hypothetical protein [Sphingomonadales bacterium]